MINDVDKFKKAQIRTYLLHRLLWKVKVKRLKLQKLRLKRNGKNACFAKMINQKKL